MKKLVAILVAVLVSLSTIAVNAAPEYGIELENIPTRTYSQKFKDVSKNHWAFTYISELVEKGILSGYPDNKFRPDNSISRAEFAKVMITASGMKVSSIEYTTFADVTVDDWYAPYVEAAKPFLNGYVISGKNMYVPDSMALREDIAVALVKLKGYDVSIADVSLLNVMFSDAESISNSAKKYIAVAIERGLISGYNDETFRGQQTITRAEAAALLWRVSQFGNDNKIVETPTEPIIEEGLQVSEKPLVIGSPEHEDGVIEFFEEDKEESKPYSIDTIVEDVDVYAYTISRNNGTVYYVTDDSVIGTDGYKLSLSCEEFSCCPEKENDKRHVCTVYNKAITYDNSSDKLLLLIELDNNTYLFDISDSRKPVMILEVDDRCYSNRLAILDNGYILNGSHLFNTKGKLVLDINYYDPVYYKNKFYWLTNDIFEVDTELRCEDINGDVTAIDSKAEFKFSDIQSFESIGNTLYVLTKVAFYKYDTEGYEEKIFRLKEDIEILDFKSIKVETDQFEIDKKGNIFFYDCNSSSIRKIFKNK